MKKVYTLPRFTYLAAIKNLINPHNYFCGPYVTYLHDLGHAIWGSMLSTDEREKLFNVYIKLLRMLLADSEIHSAIVRSEKSSFCLRYRLNKAIEHAYDFNLTIIDEYSDIDTRFIRYMAKVFGGKGNDAIYTYEHYSREHVCIGDSTSDHIYFLIEKFNHHPNLTSEERKLWNEMVEYIRSEFSFKHRDATIIKALKTLAELSAGVSPEANSAGITIDWDEWAKILSEDVDSKALWKWAQRTRHNDLLTLIINYKIPFFHPVMPLSTEQLQAFKDFVAEKVKAPTLDAEPARLACRGL